MSFAPASPVTGAVVTGLTSPTYTIVADTPPNVNGKQYAVSALGGTQTNVDINTVSKPFTVAMFRPPQLRSVPAPNPVTGVMRDIPVNSYKIVTRKGASPAANQQNIPFTIETVIRVPAGVDTYEPEEVKAAISLHFGVLAAQSSGIADTVLTGVL